MANPQTYSFLDVHMAITGPGGALNLTNGTAEEGLTLEYVDDKNNMVIGSDGSVMHSLRANNAGRATLRLLKTSPLNALLTGMYNFQRQSASTWGQNTITLADVARGDVYTLQSCSFRKFPDNSYAKDGGIMVWAFDVGIMDPLLGQGSPSIIV
jgi:hypothetical protein